MILCSNLLQILDLVGKDFRYYKECYKEAISKTKIERSKQRFDKDWANLLDRANFSYRANGQEIIMERQTKKTPDE